MTVYTRRHVEQRALHEQRKAELAELVAEGRSISAAARELGVSQQRASQLWQKVKADLGWQAK